MTAEMKVVRWGRNSVDSKVCSTAVMRAVLMDDHWVESKAAQWASYWADRKVVVRVVRKAVWKDCRMVEKRVEMLAV